jgi:ABC-type dipeptide/oligopeptide/nickel transport system permease subunit
VRAALTGDGRARFGVAVSRCSCSPPSPRRSVARHDPTAIDLGGALARPSAEHWLGTDVQGRDVWARLVYGARVSLLVGVASQVIALTLGVALGLVAGYYGRRVDDAVMRLADVTLAFPTLLLLIAMAAAFAPSLGTVVVTVGVVGGPGWRGWCAGRCSWCAPPSTCRPSGRWAPATCA